MKEGKSVVTQKFIQTGNTGFSEDIELHRRLMGIDPLPEDKDFTTSPVIFSYPASAQLAARIDNREIDLNLIDNATEKLLKAYDIVLIEGQADSWCLSPTSFSLSTMWLRADSRCCS